ncbi:MAG: phage head closure protein [Planctomycetota bacterium]
MAMRYSAGMLRQSIELHKPVESRDSIGGADLTYKPVARVYASVKPMTAREVLSADQQHPEITHRVVIRYLPNVQPEINWRLSFEGRTLEVAAPPIDVDNRRRFVQLLCREGG